MATHEIARDDWATFFEEFTRRHQGSEVEIDSVSPTAIRQESRPLPFLGIGFMETDDETGRIEIRTSTELGGDTTHAVGSPKKVYHKAGAGVMSDEVTPDEILEITSAEAPPITYLRFLRPGGDAAVPPQPESTQTAL